MNNRSRRESARSLLRAFAALGISGFPHGEPDHSHHCQNMQIGFIAFASILQTLENRILHEINKNKQKIFYKIFV